MNDLKRAQQALQEGKITNEEYTLFSHTYENEQLTKKRRRVIALSITSLVAMSIMMILALFLNQGTTGYVTWNAQEFSNDTDIALNTTSISKVVISGELLEGNAKITLITNTKEYLIYEDKLVEEKITTQYQNYQPNEEIEIISTLQNATYWLVDTETNRTPINQTFSVETTGNYTIEALTNETKESIRLEIDYEEQKNRTNTLVFENACEETCTLNETGNSTLHIETNGRILIERVLVVTNNEAPIGFAIPDLVLQERESATINLSQYFIDNNNDTLTYEINNMIGLVENIQQDILEITATNPGSYQARIYASDLQTLTYTEFDILVVANEEDTQGIQENTTQNNNTNTTTNTTNTNQTTNSTQSATQFQETTCEDPDPNKRPLSCIQNEANNYQLTPVYLEDQNRRVAARITPIGNLVIAGDIIEYSTSEPQASSWRASRFNEFGQEIAVAWVDTQTGDLHLRGQLFEEQTQMSLPKNVYSVQSKQNINLMYVDRNTGNMYIRGNIITGRDLDE